MGMDTALLYAHSDITDKRLVFLVIVFYVLMITALTNYVALETRVFCY